MTLMVGGDVVREELIARGTGNRINHGIYT